MRGDISYGEIGAEEQGERVVAMYRVREESCEIVT